jgi:molybdenum cofactor biosynthesis enzyme MoaA
MVTFIVTWRCNLRCFMCDVWKKTDHDDMTPAEAGAIFKQFPKLDTLRLTGGEPFLRRDFDDLVGSILDNVDPTVVHLTTAGVMWVSARIYRVGILMYGKRPTFPEILRWVRTA